MAADEVCGVVESCERRYRGNSSECCRAFTTFNPLNLSPPVETFRFYRRVFVCTAVCTHANASEIIMKVHEH